MTEIVDIEKSLIGAVLLNEDSFQEVVSRVRADDFLTEPAKNSFLLILSMYGKEPVNLQTVYMRSEDRFKQWVLSASDQLFSVNAGAYAEMVADDAKKRRILAKIQKIAADAAKKSMLKSDDLLDDLVSTYRGELGSNLKKYDIGNALGRFVREVEKNRKSGLGFKTGFSLLDNDFVYYRPGNLWVIGAWTSVGKTAWMIDAVRRLNARAAIFSTEMTEEMNIARLLANPTGVNANVILSGQAIDAHQRRINMAIEELRGRDIYIVDDIRDVDRIAMQCRKMQHGKGVDVIFIDFIQNLCKRGYKNKYEMMSQIAIDLQNLAHELRCTIVCLSQLPNSAGKEDAGILEFKGAGEIAAACDVGVLMKRAIDNPKVILFDVRKNRHGVCQKYLFEFDEWVRLNEIGKES